MNTAIEINTHAIGNMNFNHKYKELIRCCIPIPYTEYETDKIGCILYLFFGTWSYFTLNKEQISFICTDILCINNIDIFLPEGDVTITNRVSALSFLEAFTNACKYGDHVYISNHIRAPVITMTNNINIDKVKKPIRTSGFGLKAFSDYIKKANNNLTIEDGCTTYCVHIVNPDI
jgi:hypothetical protein